MTQIELFNKFKDEHKEVIASINTFVQQKPWFVRPRSLFVTHVVVAIMFNLNYFMRHSFGLVKHFGQIHLLPQFVLLYLKFYVKEIVTRHFTTKNVSVERNAIIVEC